MLTPHLHPLPLSKGEGRSDGERTEDIQTVAANKMAGAPETHDQGARLSLFTCLT